MRKTIYILFFCLLLAGCVNTFFNSLQGKSTQDVQEQMGQPTTILTENNHQLWTYRSEGCIQMVFFGLAGQVEDHYSFGDCE